MERSDFKPLGSILTDFIRHSGLGPRLTETRIAQAWPDIVGKPVARATTEIFFRNRKMFVKFSSPVVRAEVQMIREALIHRINELAGEKLIDEIILR
jgi:hypothetical protein